MRIARFIDETGQTQWGQDLGDGRFALLDRPPLAAFPGLPTPTGPIITNPKLLAPIEPSNIYCVGLNYRAHAQEMESTLPEYPLIFMKPTSSVIGPGEPIRVPRVEHGPETDQEAELAVVIGRPARDVTEDQALDYVLGYTTATMSAPDGGKSTAAAGSLYAARASIPSAPSARPSSPRPPSSEATETTGSTTRNHSSSPAGSMVSCSNRPAPRT